MTTPRRGRSSSVHRWRSDRTVAVGHSRGGCHVGRRRRAQAVGRPLASLRARVLDQGVEDCWPAPRARAALALLDREAREAPRREVRRADGAGDGMPPLTTGCGRNSTPQLAQVSARRRVPGEALRADEPAGAGADDASAVPAGLRARFPARRRSRCTAGPARRSLSARCSRRAPRSGRGRRPRVRRSGRTARDSARRRRGTRDDARARENPPRTVSAPRARSLRPSRPTSPSGRGKSPRRPGAVRQSAVVEKRCIAGPRGRTGFRSGSEPARRVVRRTDECGRPYPSGCSCPFSPHRWPLAAHRRRDTRAEQAAVRSEEAARRAEAAAGRTEAAAQRAEQAAERAERVFAKQTYR
jgi:hypothetical protein